MFKSCENSEIHIVNYDCYYFIRAYLQPSCVDIYKMRSQYRLRMTCGFVCFSHERFVSFRGYWDQFWIQFSGKKKIDSFESESVDSAVCWAGPIRATTVVSVAMTQHGVSSLYLSYFCSEFTQRDRHHHGLHGRFRVQRDQTSFTRKSTFTDYSGIRRNKWRAVRSEFIVDKRIEDELRYTTIYGSRQFIFEKAYSW